MSTARRLCPSVSCHYYVDYTSVFTFPYSYSQIYSTFRTACGDLTTARTNLGCDSLTDKQRSRIYT